MNVHHNHQQQLPHKLSSVVWQLYPFHHDRLSSNVFHPFHPVLVRNNIFFFLYSFIFTFFFIIFSLQVMSSSNDGSHMVLKLNAAPSFNVLLLLNNMQLHATSSSNTNQFKFVLFVNSNDLVLLNTTHKLIFNNMVLHSSMLLHLFNKHELLVSSKIS